MVPLLQLPLLVPQDQASNLPGVGASPSSPSHDMPSGPSIKTARVRHPLSSTESAALTQLRAELNALFVESQNGPDLSLVPLPRQLNQAAKAKPSSGPTKPVRMVRSNRLQARPAAPAVRRNSRRRQTADTVLSKHTPQGEMLTHAQLSRAELGKPEPHGMPHPTIHQGAESTPAETPDRASNAFGAGVRGCAAGAVQTLPKSKRYVRSNSWAAGSTSQSSPIRVGVTQSGAASTSYCK